MSAMKRYGEELRLDLEDSEVFEMLATEVVYTRQAMLETNPEDWMNTLTNTDNADTATNTHTNRSQRRVITYTSGSGQSRHRSDSQRALGV